MSVYTAPSQITERQFSCFKGKRVLVAGEAEDLLPVELAGHCESVSVFTTNYGYYRQLSAYPTINCYFDVELDTKAEADMILLYWPKAKAEAQYLLHMLFSRLGTNTEICVVGENRSGVKSIEKIFQPYGTIRKYDSARRCSFYRGICSEIPRPFRLEEWFKTYPLDIAGTHLTIKSLPGVFSHGEFDLGTQLLINTLPILQGRVLDFGCGAGVIGSVLARKNPEIELEMCDINAFAIVSSRATLQENGLQGKVFASDVYSDISGNYDFLISNPPFHSGLDTSYNATETLLEQAPKYLSSHGELYIVANSFLKYPPIIETAFGNYAAINKTSKFTIYHAKK
ncbi:16S rRNA (guanine(1207)-N(2))-methyltransferase RsmC [Vibrio sp. HA2012]|uniref:16S rRNA (guanine(1207)-N(2))-methyltransferase RsmC n=1 Tax=Vibrio sp. HA2012 TaxID=1971595 RepID=UPI000C2BDCE7|nr:16S rRNA (guanine(1207)-N(2))-methyltransferase RsmC [Vibrio sp. HA2012]PJC85045.1 16S rRNA (guanine(1207)-N(2))-methyltransferase RsmC [Vibrio sp. HA2012]